jgi:hypothetical protein
MRCDRCGRASLASTGSWFNLEQICLECSALEEQHPSIEEARERENEAVRRGDFNFPGIGLPAELRP